MANIWLHRKRTLIKAINQITDTDYDDLDISVVLNVLWTVEDEDRDYLYATLRNMTSGSFDDTSYSKSFLEQLDLICSIPVEVPEYDEEESGLDETDDESELEESESEEEFIEEQPDNLKNSAVICLCSCILLFFSLYMKRETFNSSAILESFPKWPYFWIEFIVIVAGIIFAAYLIRSITNSIAEHIATVGYLILFMPFLWLLKGFAFSSSFGFYFNGTLFIIFIASLSRICSRKTIE